MRRLRSAGAMLQSNPPRFRLAMTAGPRYNQGACAYSLSTNCIHLFKATYALPANVEAIIRYECCFKSTQDC